MHLFLSYLAKCFKLNIKTLQLLYRVCKENLLFYALTIFSFVCVAPSIQNPACGIYDTPYISEVHYKIYTQN